MASKAVVLVVASFLLVVLVCSSTSTSYARMKKIQQGCLTSPLVEGGSQVPGFIHSVCCWKQYNDGVFAGQFCQACDVRTSDGAMTCDPVSGPYFHSQGNATAATNPEVFQPPQPSPGTTTGVLNPPLGNVTTAPPTSNNTGTTLPPGSIIKVPPGTIGSASNPSNSTGNSTTMNASGAYSPTGYCVRSVSTTCQPCDPGLPGGLDTCISSSDWPGPTSFKNNTGLGIATPLGNPTNAQPIGNNTGTPPPPTGLAGQQPQTQQTTGQHHHHKGSNTGASTSTGSNSTGH